MISSGKNRTLAACLLLFIASGCGQEPVEARPEPQAASVVEQESMARSAPDAGSVERVVVLASGKGPTTQVAVDRAIRLAYEQVNGKSFDAATIGIDSGFSGQFGDSSINASASAYADIIVTQTQGAVSDFRLLSQKDVDGGVEVQIEASVEKFVQPESAGQLRVAIVPLRLERRSFTIGTSSIASDKIAQQITDDIADALLHSQRITILDREFDAEIQKELGRIDAGNWKNNDRLRLGQQLAADFVVVGRLDRFEYTRHVRKLRTSDREIISYSGSASLLVRVVNVATGQIEIAQTFNVELPETKPTSMGRTVDTGKVISELVAGLAGPAAQQITLSLFPITVVDVDGEDIVLSQGGDVVQEGQVYEIVLRGKKITDPQTGRVIGRIEKLCCTVLVTTVTPEMSYGVIKDRKIADVAAVFAPGALELRGVVEQAPPPVRAAEPTVARVATPSIEPRQESTPEPGEIPDADEDEDW